MLFSDIELTLTAEGSDRNNKTEKRARQFFFPLLMWLLPHGTNLYFARKNLGVCFLKNLEPGLIQKCPLLTLPASLWDVLCCPPPPPPRRCARQRLFLRPLSFPLCLLLCLRLISSPSASWSSRANSPRAFLSFAFRLPTSQRRFYFKMLM